MIVLLATLLSGAMFFLSQGLDNVWALAWLAPVPLLWLAYGRTPLWQLALASAVAILASAGYTLQVYRMLPVVLILSVLLPTVILFIVVVLFARLVHRKASPLVVLVAFPACWTAFEYLIGLVSPNGSFGSLAYSQMSAPILIQSASLLGLYGVTFLLCLFANTLAMALRANRATAVAIGLGLALCAANVLFGLMRLSQPQTATIRAAALVDETAMAKTWRARGLPDAIAVADTYASEIRGAAAQGARFVVTPEGGIVSTAAWRPTVLAPLATVAKDTGTQIIAGVLGVKPMADQAFALEPDGAVQGYDKRHPVPILEARFTPGTASGWLGQERAMEICKDMDFAGTIRRDAVKGVRLMGVPAGDFGGDAWIHARMAIMRGVEDGFALVRAANDGWVTLSDAEGRLIAQRRVAPAGLTMIVADLPLGPGPTFYARMGDVFPWLCAAATLSIGGYVLLARKRRVPAIGGETARTGI